MLQNLPTTLQNQALVLLTEGNFVAAKQLCDDWERSKENKEEHDYQYVSEVC